VIQENVSFTSSIKDATRQTAATFFFELLQLKTWDYIDLKQVSWKYGGADNSYGQ